MNGAQGKAYTSCGIGGRRTTGGKKFLLREGSNLTELQDRHLGSKGAWAGGTVCKTMIGLLWEWSRSSERGKNGIFGNLKHSRCRTECHVQVFDDFLLSS